MRGGEKPEQVEPSFDPSQPLTRQEFVTAAMGDQAYDSNDTANQLVLDSLGITHTGGVIDTSSDVYKKLLDEMAEQEHWSEKLVQYEDLDGAEAQQLVLGYAKAKIMNEHTDASKMESYTGGNINSRNQEVVQAIVDKSNVSTQEELDDVMTSLEVYGDVTDKDVRRYESSQGAYTAMYNRVKAAFGYVEGGDAKTNEAAETAARDVIARDGHNIRNIVQSEGVKVDQDLLDKVVADYFTFSKKDGLSQSQRIKRDSESISEEQYRAILELRSRGDGYTREALEAKFEDLDPSSDEIKRENLAGAGTFSVAGSRAAIERLREDYVTGERSVSDLTASVSGNYRAAEVAAYLKQILPQDQIEALRRDGADNAYLAASSGVQNAITAKAAQNDEGARQVLIANNVDISSLFDITQFLNSPQGEALKERLIAKISQEITALDLFAGKIGIDDAGVHSIVESQTVKTQDASVYERAQGSLVSMERVKERAQGEESENADMIAQNAVSRMRVLSRAERETVEVNATYDYIVNSDIANKSTILGSESVRFAESSAIYDAVMAKKSDAAKSVLAKLEQDASYIAADDRGKRIKAAEAFRREGLVDDETREIGKFAGRKEAIRMFGTSEDTRRQIEVGSTESRLTAYQAANERAIAGGALARQRSVAEAIWNEDDLREQAKRQYSKDHRGQSLDNLSEIDRNNYLFENYDRFLSPESDGRKKVESIMSKSKVDLQAEATSGAIIRNMSQTEFDSVVKGMKDDGQTAVSGIRQSIIKETNAGGTLTEVPDETKMTRDEVREFNESKSQIEQYYRRDNNAEEFANLYRNITLVNEEETLRTILTGGNSHMSEQKVRNARNAALRNNDEFMGATIEAVLGSKGYEGILEKIKEFLKTNSGVDYDQLSTAEKGKAVSQLLANKEFLRTSQINADKLKTGIDLEFDRRADTATNFDVKQGLSSEQILSFLRGAQGERTRDQLFRIGAHQPHHMFPRGNYHHARMHYGLNNHMMRRLMIKAILRQLYREPELRKMIADDVYSYDSKIKSMSKAEARKYINAHFAELAQKFGEKTLLKKDKNGSYSLNNQTVNNTVANKAINNLERQDFSFAGRMKMLVKETVKALFGSKAEKTKEEQEFSDKLLKKLEASSEFTGIVQKIAKPTIQEQIDTFFRAGEGKSIILETSRKLSDETDFAKRVYERANQATMQEIKDIEAAIKRLKGMMK